MSDGAAAITPVVYQQLRRLAGSFLRRRAAGTLQPTALVHEAFLRLARADPERFHDREHFLAVAATAMRQILADHARRRGADKRGGGLRPVTLDGTALGAIAAIDAAALDVLQVDALITRLAALSPRQARLVELVVFGGLTNEEAARALGVSLSSVEKEWRRARAWMQHQLQEAG